MTNEIKVKRIALRAAGSRWFWVCASIALFACAYQLENWRGHRAWNRYVETAKAKGLHLELPAWGLINAAEYPQGVSVIARIYSGTNSLDLQSQRSFIWTNRIDAGEEDWIQGQRVSLFQCLTKRMPLECGIDISTATKIRDQYQFPLAPEEEHNIELIRSNHQAQLRQLKQLGAQDHAKRIQLAMEPCSRSGMKCARRWQCRRLSGNCFPMRVLLAMPL